MVRIVLVWSRHEPVCQVMPSQTSQIKAGTKKAEWTSEFAFLQSRSWRLRNMTIWSRRWKSYGQRTQTLRLHFVLGFPTTMNCGKLRWSRWSALVTASKIDIPKSSASFSEIRKGRISHGFCQEGGRIVMSLIHDGFNWDNCRKYGESL